VLALFIMLTGTRHVTIYVTDETYGTGCGNVLIGTIKEEGGIYNIELECNVK